ncbi:unnamed protein product [Didymodactylos carnosus]|uniref:Uncharacterized protein n=1 Tax=Didymodactylos carnosus TaxID=1234261 RepID=A0A815ZIF8_9BILA|nr:unnamed protein product [Didymodactylos carnosus]CAF4452160.1 unnamed protein product [Didymodactylos carnosus]
MSSGFRRDLKVLVFTSDVEIAAKVESHLHSLGYQATVIALENCAKFDQIVEDLLRREAFDGVAIGGRINQRHPQAQLDDETFHWFNRLVNIIHECASKSKIILNKDLADLEPAIKRVFV